MKIFLGHATSRKYQTKSRSQAAEPTPEESNCVFISSQTSRQ